jgi:hypothetical protein
MSLDLVRSVFTAGRPNALEYQLDRGRHACLARGPRYAASSTGGYVAAGRLHAWPWPAGPRAARPYACAAVIVRERYVRPAWASPHCVHGRTYSLMAGSAQSRVEQSRRCNRAAV